MVKRHIPAWAAIICAAGAAALAGEPTVTVRFGEQDTCSVTGVTTKQDNVIRFDLSKFARDTKIVRAELRYWIDYGKRRGLGRAYGFGRYKDEAFDGFSVRDAAEAGGRPLDTLYPFNDASYGLFVYDVTTVVRRWVADPVANRGLRADAPLPGPDLQPAWQRPYLQVTYVGPNQDRPKQPTELKARYRHGQVFLTWKQAPHDGAFFDATYRVYRHTDAITAENLAEATRLGEVHRLSQLNHRRSLAALGGRYGPGKLYRGAGVELPKRFNFVVDDTWPERDGGGAFLRTAELKTLKEDPKYRRGGAIIHQGPALPDDAGVFVWTVKKAGAFHYAVTAIREGNENREDFGPGNTAAVEQKAAEPRPVLQAVFNLRKNHHGHYYQHREYVLWGGERFHNTPSTPLCFLLTTYSTRGRPEHFDPPADLDKTRLGAWTSVVVQLHGYSSHYWHNVPRGGVNFDTNTIPPTPRAPFPADRAVNMRWKEYGTFYYGSKKRPEQPETASWWPGFVAPYGYVETYNTGDDARSATVQPYLERLVRYQTEFLRHHFPVNPNRIVTGGESGSLQLAIHCGDLFAWADVSQNAPWSAPVADRWQTFVGLRTWKLKNPEGVNVWDWNDPDAYSRRFPRKVWPWLTHLQATNYAGGDYWKTWGLPDLYLDLARNRRGFDGWWTNCGDCPNGVPQRVPRDQAYPAFANCNFSDDIRKAPGKIQRGTLFGYLDWSKGEGTFGVSRRRGRTPPKETPKLSTALVDRADRFEMALRISERRTHTNSSRNVTPTRATHGKTDVTPRRLQRFKVKPGAKYVWENRRVMTGRLLQSGVVQPDDHGLITVPGFFVDKHALGNKLILTPADGRQPPAVDRTQTVDGLAYDAYVEKCLHPEPYLTVKPPATTFVTSEIGLGTHYKGGDEWGGNMAEVFHFPQAGRYRLTVRAKGRFGLGWPMMWVQIGRERRGLQVIDHTEFHDYHWWDIPVPEGLHEVKLQCGKGYYYQRGTAGPGVRSRETTIQSITLTRLPEKQVEPARPVEVRVMPRRVELPAGFPTQFSARVIDQYGRDMQTAVTWTASGGTVTRDGVFRAEPGEYVVTAAAGEVRDEAPVVVGKRFFENFDTNSTRGWAVQDLGKKPGTWVCPLGGNTPPLQSLLSKNRADSRSVFVWQHGTPWKDYVAQADVIWPVGRRAFREQGSVGVVVRAAGKSHYRFELDRAASVARFVKHENGTDTALAETKTLPDQARLDPGTNPIFPAFHPPEARKGKSYEWLKTWGIDRIRVSARVNRFRVTVNGEPVFEKEIIDPALPAGTAGLFAATGAWFDNVTVTPVP
jgi:hypothetical protein